jgi:hypothetical protein
MNNQPIADDLARLQRGFTQRAPRWNAVFAALSKAEDAARQQFMSITYLKDGRSPNWIDQKLSIRYAFANTTVLGIPANGLEGRLVGPLGHGFDWFAAIFNSLHGRAQSAYHPGDVRTEAISFSDLENLGKRVVLWLGREFEQLIKAVGSDPEGMPTNHAGNAMSAMLLSALLYPPAKAPDVAQLALSMEWTMWVYYMSNVAEATYEDRSRDEAYHFTLVDVGPILNRLQDIARRAAAAGLALPTPSPMRDLGQFRRELEKGTVPSIPNFENPTLELKIAVRWPPPVMAYIAADTWAKRQQIYMHPGTSFSDAQL